MLTTLALADGWPIVISAINTIVSVAVGLGMFWLKNKLQEMSSLKIDIRKYAEKLIDEKIGQLRGSIDGIHSRLDRGDNEFRKNVDRDHELELKTLQVVTEIQREMATRAELQSLADKMQQHDSRLAVLEQKGAA